MLALCRPRHASLEAGAGQVAKDWEPASRGRRLRRLCLVTLRRRSPHLGGRQHVYACTVTPCGCEAPQLENWVL